MTRLLVIALLVCLALAGCKSGGDSPSEVGEDIDAKAMLQGIWIESATETISFRAEGDTIYYPSAGFFPY